tara:strand:- start:194 stop:310 length:117 start_codon:yes stop_codon:yes gene_type:complete
MRDRQAPALAASPMLAEGYTERIADGEEMPAQDVESEI